jgi:hypothetical protein
MYDQFCRNVENYIKINTKSRSRLNTAKELLPLTDMVSYQDHKEKRDKPYEDVGKLIYALKTFQKEYPRIKKFIWELWAYGFDAIEEKIELIDLLLHTHYFI